MAGDFYEVRMPETRRKLPSLHAEVFRETSVVGYGGAYIDARAGQANDLLGQADEAYVESYPSELEYVMTISEPGGGLRHWHRRRALCIRLVYC